MTAAAEAAGVTERTVYRWLARFRDHGPGGAGRSRARSPQRIAAQDAARSGRGDLRAAPAAADRRRDRRAPVDAALDGLGGAQARRAGQALAARAARAGQPLRAPPRRASSSTSTSRSSAGSSVPATRSPATAASARRAPIDVTAACSGTAGWEFVHVAIDDYSRLAYAEVLADETASTAIGFLRRALAFFARHGIRVERVMTDNGSAYRAHAAPPRLPAARHQAPPHPPLPARAPTAKPNASSRPSPATGPTAAPTAQAPSAPQRSTPGSTTTTSPDHTAASATSHPAHD